MALQFASEHPDKVQQLILVSPYFLQQRPSLMLRHAWMGRIASRLMSLSSLGSSLHPDGAKHPAVAAALDSLGRVSVRRNLFTYLAHAAGHQHRVVMQEMLGRVTVPVTLVAGENDPLLRDTTHETIVVPGAGHHPQLTHPVQLAEIIAARFAGNFPEHSAQPAGPAISHGPLATGV